MKKQGTFKRVVGHVGYDRLASIPGFLVPADDAALEIMGAIKEGHEVLTWVHTPRNVRQHRLAWALADILAEARDDMLDRDHAVWQLKMAAKHYTLWLDATAGQVKPVVKSIAFASLDQVHFDRIFNRFIHVIVTDLVPGIEEEALRKRVLELVDGDLGRRYREQQRIAA